MPEKIRCKNCGEEIVFITKYLWVHAETGLLSCGNETHAEPEKESKT